MLNIFSMTTASSFRIRFAFFVIPNSFRNLLANFLPNNPSTIYIWRGILPINPSMICIWRGILLNNPSTIYIWRGILPNNPSMICIWRGILPNNPSTIFIWRGIFGKHTFVFYEKYSHLSLIKAFLKEIIYVVCPIIVLILVKENP